MPSITTYLASTRSDFPIAAAQVSLARNSEFNDPFTGDEATGWQSSGGYTWDNTGIVLVSNGAYLYQQVSGLVAGANYELRIGITAYYSGTLDSFLTNGYNTAQAGQTMSAAGDFVIAFNNSVAGSTRFHVYGNNTFSGVLDYVRLVRV